MTHRIKQPSSPRLYVTVFLLALLLRAGYGSYRMTQSDAPAGTEFPDEEQYWMMAQSLHDGDGLCDEMGFRATRMPLYPGLLSLFAGLDRGVVWAKAAQWVIGAIGAALAAWLAGLMFDRRVAWVAGVAVAADPFLVFFASLLLTETLHIVALLLLWGICWPMVRAKDRGATLARWFAAGAAAALAVYSRESTLGLIVVLFGVIVIRGWRQPRVWAGAGIAILVVVLALCPWAARNRRVTGDWCWLTHRAGISLYDGVGPGATGASDLGQIKQMEAVRDLDEVAWNQWFWDESIRAMRDDPGRILRLAPVKWARMWNPIPNVSAYQSGLIRLVSAGWMLPTFALGAIGVGLALRRHVAHGPVAVFMLLLPAVYFTLLHGVFVGSVRYRLGAVVLIEVLAATALVAAAERIGKGSDATTRS